jgi:hypothetical protein
MLWLGGISGTSRSAPLATGPVTSRQAGDRPTDRLADRLTDRQTEPTGRLTEQTHVATAGGGVSPFSRPAHGPWLRPSTMTLETPSWLPAVARLMYGWIY